MALKPETRFKNRIRPLLEAIPNSYWVKIAQISGVGVPDFFGCVNRQFVAIELKDTGEQPEPIQEYHLQKAVRAGGFGFVMQPCNYKEILEILHNFACNSAKKAEK